MDLAFCAHGEDWLKVKEILIDVGGMAIIRRIEEQNFIASMDIESFSDGFYFLWIVESGYFSVKSLDGSFSRVLDPFAPWISRHVFGDENVPMIAPGSYPKLINFDIKGCNQHDLQPVPISHFGWTGNRSNEIIGDEISIVSQNKWRKLRNMIRKYTTNRTFELDGAPFPAKILCFDYANNIY